jgi:tetratricopeptide (TPR) repeat protein
MAQKAGKTNYEKLVRSYAIEANRLDLQTNKDSVDKAYKLHTRILVLNKKQMPSYRSKIAIEYKRGEIKKALNTANAFVINLPDYADAWVYLGIVQTRLADSTKAWESFKKAIILYSNQIREVEDTSWQNDLKFKRAIVINFLGRKVPVYSEFSTDENGNSVSTAININEAESVEAYVNRFMTYNGITFF